MIYGVVKTGNYVVDAFAREEIEVQNKEYDSTSGSQQKVYLPYCSLTRIIGVTGGV